MLLLVMFPSAEYSLGIQSTYSFFSTGTQYRPNPIIDDGLLRSMRFDLRIGEAPVPLDLVLHNALEISVEHSSPSLMHSEFDFTRFNGSISWNVQTFGNSLLFPPVLRLLLEGGFGDGNLPAATAVHSRFTRERVCTVWRLERIQRSRIFRGSICYDFSGT